MTFTRRNFLKTAGALGALMMLPGNLLAATGGGERTLVLLHLRGGNDGLNTVVPYRDKLYYKMRPTLAIRAKDVLSLNQELGLHPSMTGFAKLYESGRLAVINGVGYPDPSLSHFKSTEIWYGATRNVVEGGWAGRFLDQQGSDGLGGLALDSNMPLSLQGKTQFSPACTDLQQFHLPSSMRSALPLYRGMTGRADTLGEVARMGASGLEVAKKLSRLRPHELDLGGDLAGDLGTVLSLLKADLGLKVVQLSLDGFDTHVNQPEDHGYLLRQLSDGLLAFQTELQRMGLEDRVLTLVFSEFGRRPKENYAAGTDHGTAGPLFLIGKGVKPGFHGIQPRLDRLDDGNLQHTVDFRQVYASLLESWFQVEPQSVLGPCKTGLELVA